MKEKYNIEEMLDILIKSKDPSVRVFRVGVARQGYSLDKLINDKDLMVRNNAINTFFKLLNNNEDW